MVSGLWVCSLSVSGWQHTCTWRLYWWDVWLLKVCGCRLWQVWGADCARGFPSLCSVMSWWQSEIGRGGGIYTAEMGKLQNRASLWELVHQLTSDCDRFTTASIQYVNPSSSISKATFDQSCIAAYWKFTRNIWTLSKSALNLAIAWTLLFQNLWKEKGK